MGILTDCAAGSTIWSAPSAPQVLRCRQRTTPIAGEQETLDKLDALRDRGMSIVILGHTKIASFKNPEGEDYDRFQPDLHKKTAAAFAEIFANLNPLNTG